MDSFPGLNSSNIEPQTGPSMAATGDSLQLSDSDAASVGADSHFYTVATRPASPPGVNSPDESLPNASYSRTDADPSTASAADSTATVRCADRKDVASSAGTIATVPNPAVQEMTDDCKVATTASVTPPSAAAASSPLVARVQVDSVAGEIGCAASGCRVVEYESSAGYGGCGIERMQNDSVLGETVDASYRVDPGPNEGGSAALATAAAAAVAASSGDELMPNEGFDTDDSETAGVYDVSHGNANPDVAAAGGGANHVIKRLRRGFVRRRPSDGSSSDSSSSAGDSNAENGHRSDDLSVVNHDSDNDSIGSTVRRGEERRRNRSSNSSSRSSSSRTSDGVPRRADESSSDIDSDSDSDSDSSADSDYVGPSAAKQPATADRALTGATASTEAAPQPLPTCQFVHQFNCRERGALHGHVPTAFTHRLMGSVNLVQRLELYGTLDYHSGCVNTATFNSKGTLLTSGSDDLEVVVWDWARRQALLHFESGHHNNVFQSKFMVHSDDTQIVTSARDGQVRLAELSTTGVCRSTRLLAQHRGAVHKLAVEPDAGHTLLSAGEDGVTFQIDLREEKPTKLLCTKENGQKVPLYSIDKNPCNAHEFIVSGRDQFIRTYDKRKLTGGEDGAVPVKKFCPHALVDAGVREKANVTCCVYNYDGSEVLGTYNDDDIYLFNNQHSDGAEHVRVFKGHRNSATVKGVNFYGPRSEFVVSGSDCGNIFLWDKKTEQIVQFMHGDEGGVVNVLEPHRTFPVLATSGLDHDIKLWMPTAAEPTRLHGLAKIIKKNGKERKKDRQRQPQVIDGHMLWMIMQHIQRSARRAGRNPEGTAGGEAGNDDPSNSDSESSDDESELPFRAPSCTTS